EEGVHVDMDDLAQAASLVILIPRCGLACHGARIGGAARFVSHCPPGREFQFAKPVRGVSGHAMGTLTTESERRTIGQRELVVMVAMLMSLNALSIDGMLPAVDEIAFEFGVGDGHQRLMVVAVFLLSTGFGSLLPGSVADRFGRRPVLLVSLGFYAVLS